MAVRAFEDDVEHLAQIARALSNPNSNPKYPGYILIRYFWLVSHNKNVQKF